MHGLKDLTAEWMASYRLRHAYIFTGAENVECACAHKAACERNDEHAATNTVIVYVKESEIIMFKSCEFLYEISWLRAH